MESGSGVTLSRRLLFFTLFLTYICVGIIGILPGPTLLLLAAHTNVSLDIAGWSFTASALGFVFGVLIAGGLSGRIGPKYFLLGGLAIMAIAGLITPLAHLFPLLLAAQFTLGIGFGFLDVSINMVATLAFQDMLSEALNNLHSAYGLGALIGPLLLSATLAMTRDAFWAYGAGALVGAACILLLLRQHIPSPSQQEERQQAEQTGQQRRLALRSIFGQMLLWLLALQFFFYVGAEVGFSNWIVTAVSQSAAITLALAAPSATAFWCGLTVGRLLSAQMLKREVLSEQQLLYLCIIGGGVSGLIVAIFPGQIAISFSASALVGLFFGPLFPSIMAMASRWFMHALGIVSGVILVSSGISGMIFPVLMGILIPSLGINWVMTIPSIICLLIALPFGLALRQGRRRQRLHLPADMSTMEREASLSPTTQL